MRTRPLKEESIKPKQKNELQTDGAFRILPRGPSWRETLAAGFSLGAASVVPNRVPFKCVIVGK